MLSVMIIKGHVVIKSDTLKRLITKMVNQEEIDINTDDKLYVYDCLTDSLVSEINDLPEINALENRIEDLILEHVINDK